jgi:excinuclease ABC subunit C
MKQEEFQHIAPSLPTEPGIYKYFDSRNELIYVGKAKHLRKRISSYFNKTQQSFKTHELVKRIERIEFTIVDSEQDALLLENSLIKEYRPKYNILLKDDKSYPYIVVRKEPFPRVHFTYKRIPDGSTYLGPYASGQGAREILAFIKETIPLRNCTLPLSETNIKKGKFKVCLEYHLGNCKGPCEAHQSIADYENGIGQVKDLLRGNLGPVIKHFEKEMKEAAGDLAFEKAAQLKAKLDSLHNYQARSVVAGAGHGNYDVFSLRKWKNNADKEEKVFVNYLMVRNGSIIQTHNVALSNKLEETDAELLSAAIAQLRSNFESDAEELVVPFAIEYADPNIQITIPKAGDKKKLLELSEKNAGYFIEEAARKDRLQLTKSEIEIEKTLIELQSDLQLSETPTHIECFDNSNFQGSYPVSAMVCFKDGLPSKKDYRHFNVKTVEGINDFATMKEAVYRRYKKLSETNSPLPQLIIIDGGKGQLGAAIEAMTELNLIGKTTLVGLAKNEEELFFSGDQQSLKLSYNGPSLLLIRRIRDEVHRFGITFHRNKRSKGTFKNELEEIQGIGPSIAKSLLNHFRSVKNVSTATETEIAKLIGPAKAKLVAEYFLSKTKKH